MSDVVVTGIGAITPVGLDARSTWSSLLAGTSGIRPLENDWVAEAAVTFAGQVPSDLSDYFERVEQRRLDRSAQLAIVAALEAWRDAGFSPDDHQVDPERLAVAVGTGIGGINSTLDNWDALRDKGPRRVSPFAIPMLMANAPAAQVGLRLGAQASITTPVSACASSNEAIGQAVGLIRNNLADVVVTGGTESPIHPLPVAAFANMQALSRRNDEPQRASRPWDTGRDGFVLSEGAAMLVVERLEHARARGATIYGTVAGRGLSADSHDIVQPEPTGRGQISAMRKALRDAGIDACDVHHVNAHATSTPQGDRTEAISVREVLGAAADHTVVTGTKSMTGHLLGGAGALEALATLLALNTRQVPPTINLDDPEPDLPIDVATAVRALPEGDLAALNNSFGFGGHNVAVVITNQNQSRDLS